MGKCSTSQFEALDPMNIIVLSDGLFANPTKNHEGYEYDLINCFTIEIIRKLNTLPSVLFEYIINLRPSILIT